MAAYNAAISKRVSPPQGVLFSVLQGYQASQDFLGLAQRTRYDYVRQIKIIEREFGDRAAPVKGWSARDCPRWCSAQGRAGRNQADLHHHPNDKRRPPLDLRWFSFELAKSLRKGGSGRGYFP